MSELTQQQLKRTITEDDRLKISDLQDAINHKSVDVYLHSNFTTKQLLQICRICRIEPKQKNKDAMIQLLIHKMVNKNQSSILEITEYVLSTANLTYHVLGNALTGFMVVLSSNIMFHMLRKAFQTKQNYDSSDFDQSIVSPQTTGLVFMVSMIFLASKNVKLPSLRMNMKAHKESLKDQNDVFNDTMDSISRHKRIKSDMKRTKRTSRVARLSYAIREVKRNGSRDMYNTPIAKRRLFGIRKKKKNTLRKQRKATRRDLTPDESPLSESDNFVSNDISGLNESTV